eukprot:360663-Chlamydomonas_euryale.AAC.15
MEQLMVGVLLFVPLLILLPTTALWWALLGRLRRHPVSVGWPVARAPACGLACRCCMQALHVTSVSVGWRVQDPMVLGPGTHTTWGRSACRFAGLQYMQCTQLCRGGTHIEVRSVNQLREVFPTKKQHPFKKRAFSVNLWELFPTKEQRPIVSIYGNCFQPRNNDLDYQAL